MKLLRFPLIMVAFIMACSVFALSQSEVDMDFARPIDYEAAITNIRTTIDLAMLAQDEERDQVMAMVRNSLHILRGPNVDHKTYRYATVRMDDKVEPVTLLHERLASVWEYGQKDVLRIEASTIYAFQIHMPDQRGFFKNNGNMYLDSYKVEYTIDGEKKTESRQYRNWVTRDSVIDIPLPGIAEYATLEIVAGVSPADIDHSIVELRVFYPEVSDSPLNPFSYAVEQLDKSLDRLIEGYRINSIIDYHDLAIAAIEEVPASLASEPTMEQVAECAPQQFKDKILEQLKEIIYLMKGDEEDQAEGGSKLEGLVNTLEKVIF